MHRRRKARKVKKQNIETQIHVKQHKNSLHAYLSTHSTYVLKPSIALVKEIKHDP